MRSKWIGYIFTIAILGVLGIGPDTFPAWAVQGEVPDATEGLNVLAHGPIHEAFAETVAFDPEPGIIVSKAPPEPINEIPPEQKPEGDPEWIPGYWAWDDDQNDFIWISGTWRVVPPDRQWIPGYWVKSGNGYQWISGYWAAEEQKALEYLPVPPESVEVGPNVPAPSANYSWIPGCWIWSYGRYAWRPGYWAVMRPDWVWVPAHYVWTPGGYIFVGGYWDFAVGQRGVLFAPVAFGAGITFGPRFYFTPAFMIDFRVFSDCLFLRPRYHHYYFGDYYAHRYYRRGIFPWFSPHARRHGYDPIYAHQRWKHRHDRNWEKDLHATYQERVKYEEARPPRTLHDSRALQRKKISSKASVRSFKQPFIPVTNDRKKIAEFRPLSKNERQRYELRGKRVRTLSNERSEWESQARSRRTGEVSSRIEAKRVKLPKSPIVARPSGPELPKKGVSDPIKPTQPRTRIESPQKKSVDVPGSSRKIETERRTMPKSPGVSRPSSSPSRWTGSEPGKRRTPPARYKAPQPDPTVQPLQRRPSGTPQTSRGIERDRESLPRSPTVSTPPRGPSGKSGSTPGRIESPGFHSPPQSAPRVENP